MEGVEKRGPVAARYLRHRGGRHAHHAGRQLPRDIRGKAHVFDGEIFTRLILPGKGPIGFILKPDGQGSLTFTSTRTQRNATYSKLPGNPCPNGAIGRPGVAPNEEGH